MSNSQKKPAPVSFRVTPEERAQLERDSGDMPVGAYIRSRIFDPTVAVPRHQGKAPVKDHQALSRVLALLGQSRIASNLNQLAKAAHIGSLPIGPEIEAELREAVIHVAAIRRMLVDALGLSEGKP